MARSEARLSTLIWSDDDFRALSVGAQWLFMFLISQPDLSHLGVLPLRERRWARSARGLTAKGIAEGFAELSAGRFVVVDEETEEVLVRSLVRRDGVYRQPNILRAAEKDLPLVESEAIRNALAAELHRVSTADDMPDGSKGILTRMIEGLPNPTANPSPNPSPDGSANPTPGTTGDRGVVTTVRSDSPFPLFPEAPDTRTPARAASVRAIGSNSPHFDRFWAAYPRKEAKGAARKAWDKAIQKTTPDAIITGAERFSRLVAKDDPRYIAHPATWLNAERWEDQPAGRTQARPDTGANRHVDQLTPEERAARNPFATAVRASQVMGDRR